jgi:DNA replication protein DnaD
MSVTAMSRTFWTEFPELSYINKKGKTVNIKNSTAKIVLLAIADNSDDFGENSYQSFDTLATKSSIDRRSVIRVVRALVNHGFLEVAGVSAYGTNNYTVCLDKLGHPPKRRAKTGRPKSSDVESLAEKSGDVAAESSDSEEKSGDSVTESSDRVSPESSSILPSSVQQTDEEEETQMKAEILKVFYESSVGPITTIVMDKLDKAAREYPNQAWYHPAFEVMKEHADHRSWNYVEKVLQGWKEHYFGWKPGDDRKRPGKKQSVAQSGDYGKYITPEYADLLEH